MIEVVHSEVRCKAVRVPEGNDEHRSVLCRLPKSERIGDRAASGAALPGHDGQRPKHRTAA